MMGYYFLRDHHLNPASGIVLRDADGMLPSRVNRPGSRTFRCFGKTVEERREMPGRTSFQETVLLEIVQININIDAQTGLK